MTAAALWSCAAVPLVPRASASSTVRTASLPNRLLALGDSLAAGYQPIYRGQTPPIDTATGFPDTGYVGSYPAVLAAERHLTLTDLGCPGETSTSFLTAPAQSACSALYKDEFGASSQLAAARSFLHRHRHQVSYVTLDIGANDIDHCISASTVYLACFVRTEARLQQNFTNLVRNLQLTLAADDPTARILIMNYYDPFLGLALHPGGRLGARLASESLAAVNAFNVQLSVDARNFKLPIANVATAFRLNTLLPLAVYDNHRLPTNVITDCQLTWMCPIGSTSGAPDIHPNLLGYKTIADAFAQLLPRPKAVQ